MRKYSEWFYEQCSGFLSFLNPTYTPYEGPVYTYKTVESPDDTSVDVKWDADEYIK